MQGFPLIEVSGPARERGLQHGAAVSARVAGSVALYRDQMHKRGVGIEQQSRLARGLIPVIEAYDPRYLEEMQGIADGAGVSIEDIVTINCRTEMMFGYERMRAGQPPVEKSDGCTGLIVLPEASANGRLLHAHNWDWREECADTCIVLRIRSDEGPDILTFCEAGALARHGFNSSGIAITGNFLMCERDFLQPGQAPLALIRRKLLECPSLATAMAQLWKKSRYCSNNLMLSHAGGEAVNLECAPDEIFWTLPENGILAHANHWICPIARGKLRDLGLGSSPDSLYRQRRVADALRKQAGSIDFDVLKTILADEYGKPDSVLRTPKAASFDSISATVATTLMDPGDGVMWIARQPYATREFVEYRL